MASRELRNNNYLNLKNGGYPWMDANGKDRELIHRVMRSLPILSMECALEFYCCALISSPTTYGQLRKIWRVGASR